MTLGDLHPDAFYTADEVAGVLRLQVDTVYRLGCTPRLPKVAVGPRGGKTLFRGRDIIAYAESRAA